MVARQLGGRYFYFIVEEVTKSVVTWFIRSYQYSMFLLSNMQGISAGAWDTDGEVFSL
jgi:hypothetical protein